MMRFFWNHECSIAKFQIFTQEYLFKKNDFEIIVDQSNIENLNLATKRISSNNQENILETRDIKNVSITYQINNVNIGSV